MWMMEAKTPVEVYARAVDKALGPEWKGIDATTGMITFSDGSIYQSTISWALPVVWPGAVYSLDVGIVGTDGVLTIDDTHRDIVLAASKAQGMGYVADGSRLVDFVGSTPAGDPALGALRGPLHQHAGHRRAGGDERSQDGNIVGPERRGVRQVRHERRGGRVVDRLRCVELL